MNGFEYNQYLRRERLRSFYGKGAPDLGAHVTGRRFRQMLLREARKSASAAPWTE